ncbi:hypothetical protein H6P81_010790 [Aristolochia fimbriata]|uniref:J domain-containing protein n=1 Tax=Aristolochia fimbriata TaxID=158543 RepID=A0AAV7EPS1_ARIFI|nr:hypothetical protein H6P81_010790 [Aristolochia fimbriata]
MAPAASCSDAVGFLAIAEKLLISRDLVGCKKFANQALNADPLLDGVDQIIAVADVLLAAEERVNNHYDWYAVLKLDVSSGNAVDLAAVKKKYRKLAMLLHPDKNKMDGADSAFKLVADAWSVLSDPRKRSLYDKEREIALRFGSAQGKRPAQAQSKTGCAPESVPAPTADPGSENFWTACPYCYYMYEYGGEYENCNLKCQTCNRPFRASEVKNLPPTVPGMNAYYCNLGFFPMGSPGFNSGPQGFNSGRQGFNPGPQWFNPGPQGFHSGPQGFHAGPQGFHPGPQGFHPGPQGFNPGPQGFNPVYPNPYMGMGFGGGQAMNPFLPMSSGNFQPGVIPNAAKPEPHDDSANASDPRPGVGTADRRPEVETEDRRPEVEAEDRKPEGGTADPRPEVKTGSRKGSQAKSKSANVKQSEISNPRKQSVSTNVEPKVVPFPVRHSPRLDKSKVDVVAKPQQPQHHEEKVQRPMRTKRKAVKSTRPPVRKPLTRRQKQKMTSKKETSKQDSPAAVLEDNGASHQENNNAAAPDDGHPSEYKIHGSHEFGADQNGVCSAGFHAEMMDTDISDILSALPRIYDVKGEEMNSLEAREELDKHNDDCRRNRKNSGFWNGRNSGLWIGGNGCKLSLGRNRKNSGFWNGRNSEQWIGGNGCKLSGGAAGNSGLVVLGRCRIVGLPAAGGGVRKGMDGIWTVGREGNEGIGGSVTVGRDGMEGIGGSVTVGRDGMVGNGFEGKGGKMALGRVVGMLGIEGKGGSVGRDGFGSVGMVGNGVEGSGAGNVGLGREGIVGKVGPGAWRRWRAASLTSGDINAITRRGKRVLKEEEAMVHQKLKRLLWGGACIAYAGKRLGFYLLYSFETTKMGSISKLTLSSLSKISLYRSLPCSTSTILFLPAPGHDTGSMSRTWDWTVRGGKENGVESRIGQTGVPEGLE